VLCTGPPPPLDSIAIKSRKRQPTFEGEEKRIHVSGEEIQKEDHLEDLDIDETPSNSSDLKDLRK
jgi:hypothetical protein